ncbi:MAG: hypothetical protein R2941_20215 [Desulfobacterales bacterium]
MKNSLFRVLFTKKVRKGHTPREVLNELSKMLKTDTEKLKKWLTQEQPVIKSGLDYETALKYREFLDKSGGIFEVEEDLPAEQSEKKPEKMRSSDGQSKQKESSADPAASAHMISSCPKCGYSFGKEMDIEKAGDCPACGIILSKYQKQMGKISPNASANRLSPDKEQTGENLKSARDIINESLADEDRQDLCELANRLLDSYDFFAKHYEKCLTYSGYRKKGDKLGSVMTIVGLVGLGAGIYIWVVTKWYWGILAIFLLCGIPSVFLENILKSESNRFGSYFIDNVPAAFRSNASFFAAALSTWTEYLSDRTEQFEFAEHTHGLLHSALEKYRQQNLSDSEQAEAEKYRKQIEEIWKIKSLKRAEKKAEKENREAEERNRKARMAEQEKKAWEELAKIFPGASKPVFGNELRLKGDFGTQIQSSFYFFHYDGGLVISGNSTGTDILAHFPNDCIRNVSWTTSQSRINIESLVNQMFNEKVLPRIEIDVIVPIYFKLDGGYSDFYGVSFTLGTPWDDEKELRRITQEWRKFGSRDFGPFPKCPECNRYSIQIDRQSFSSTIGLSAPVTKGMCKCGGVFEYNYIHGKWVSLI